MNATANIKGFVEASHAAVDHISTTAASQAGFYITNLAFWAPSGEYVSIALHHDGTLGSFVEEMHEYAEHYDADAYAQRKIEEHNVKYGDIAMVRVIINDADTIGAILADIDERFEKLGNLLFDCYTDMYA